MTISIKKVFSSFKSKNANKERKFLPYLQRIGKSVLFPIAMLPFAAIFLRIGAMIPATTEFSKIVGMVLSTVGNAVFGPMLPVLFGIGVSFGMTKDQRGEAAIVGFVTMMFLQIFLAEPQIAANGDKVYAYGLGMVDIIYGNLNISPDPGNPAFGFGGTNGLLGSSGIVAGSYQNIMVDNVLNGIVVGIFVSTIYNKFNGLELPSVLGFFSGRRLVPVLALSFGIFFAFAYVLIFPWVAWVITQLSYAMSKAAGNRFANSGIMFGYGLINRLLIPFGLHHIPNTLFWFTIGNFGNVSGDINIFLKAPAYIQGVGYNNAGIFQSGFFPIMMFGLPALSYAFYRFSDNKEQAKRVGALLFGSSAVSFITGITEPLEFSFMFISPILFMMHAFLTAFWGGVVGLFGIQIGFGFSAGLIDFILSIPKSLEIINAKVGHLAGPGVAGAYSAFEGVMANPMWLFPIGILTAGSYFFGAKILIQKFGAPAPGRGANQLGASDDSKEDQNSKEKIEGSNKYTKDALKIIKAIGLENFENVEWCATRLRLTLKDNANIDINLIKSSCSRGEIKIGSKGFQIIIGPSVEMLGNEVIRLLANKDQIEDLNQKILV